MKIITPNPKKTQLAEIPFGEPFTCKLNPSSKKNIYFKALISIESSLLEKIVLCSMEIIGETREVNFVYDYKPIVAELHVTEII